ncbi:glycosyltransferase family 2 protein [Amnibacterium sp.]|uniref:glycosyltransferase family 2 protein n=1 Tax=Amnibacterium sp. TaxID=1872496 RepID=UPI00261CE260|nr:glycosyltransferase family 2 protein [Amnibacterium sp.]MCU1474382.1 glycosyl transferase [Amnibacterium sp.]
MSRRTAAEWASHAPAPEPLVDVLIGTVGRTGELAVTLAGLAAQDDPPFRVLVSDQSDTHPAATDPAVQAMFRVLEVQGRQPRLLRHRPRRGIAEHRDFLLRQATADAVLFLDDDVWLEPGALQRLHEALSTLACGFVGMAPQGLSYLDDRRPQEQQPFERWDGPVRPERIRRGEPGFERWTLHNAANLVHVAADQADAARGWVPYRIAWIGACVLYRRAALVECGGFGFWSDLPPAHAGEDVVAQWRVMERYGAAGLLPSGAVHLEAPTTIPNREVDAPDVVFAADRLAG